MLKYRRKVYKTNFTKKKNKYSTFILNNGTVFSLKKVQYQVKLLLNFIKKIRKRFKKRKITMYLYFDINFIKSYKSKNARMGKGKGSLKKHTIRKTKRTVCLINNSFSNDLNLIKKIKYILK